MSHLSTQAAFVPRFALAALLVTVAAAPSMALICPIPPNVIDPLNGTPITGDTSNQPDTAQTYDCADSSYAPPGPPGGYTGGEDVYQFTLTGPASLGFGLIAEHSDMRLLLLSTCDETNCLSEGACGEVLAPGTYLLVVDGINGAAGRYTIQPLLLDGGLPRWHDCPECLSAQCSQTPADLGLRKWAFDSVNYCGTGCDFSLYAVVGCGTELHVPFFDAETGHMKIYDLLRQSGVNLIATNELPVNMTLPPACRYTTSGQAVQWEDTGCSAIPCPGGNCGGGNDCRTNNMLLDVELLGSPLLCGVYRIDFINWGGFVWEAVANCTADRAEQFFIYRDPCSALANWRPRPELGIERVTYDETDCDTNRLTGQVSIENIGCLDAVSDLTIEEVGVGNPQVTPFTLASGQSLLLDWSYDFTVAPTTLRFTLDAANSLPECSEDLSSNVPCGRSTVLAHSREFTACAAGVCSTQAIAGRLGDPRSVCAGDAAVLDGSGSIFRCLTGGTAEYRWEDSESRALPGCDWGTSATCTVATDRIHLGKNRFSLLTRCSGAGTACSASEGTAIVLLANALPPVAGNVLRGVRQGSDVVFSWIGTAGGQIATERLYRSAAIEVPVAGRTVVGSAPSSSTVGLIDPGALGTPTAFYQLVGVSCAGDLEGGY